jgi:hypothetical protein
MKKLLVAAIMALGMGLGTASAFAAPATHAQSNWSVSSPWNYDIVGG